MKIIFDIHHPCDINFFKNTINILSKDNDVIIISLNRGPINRILDKEMPDIRRISLGNHKGTFISIILSNIKRFFYVMPILIKEKTDICFGFGGFSLSAACRFLGVNNIQFYDDIENTRVIFLCRLFANKVYMPEFMRKKNDFGFYALKEWCYLSPAYFTPNINALKAYDVLPHQYIFVREISAGSLNYSKQKEQLISEISHQLPKNFKVLLSLEDKKTKDMYPSDWIILQEPIEDIYSLMYFSRIVISSGDSMAREGAVLGVPSIYCGVRQMIANQVLIDKGMLFHEKNTNIAQSIDEIVNNKKSIEEQDKFRNVLLNEWQDITKLLIDIFNEEIKSRKNIN